MLRLKVYRGKNVSVSAGVIVAISASWRLVLTLAESRVGQVPTSCLKVRQETLLMAIGHWSLNMSSSLAKMPVSRSPTAQCFGTVSFSICLTCD